MNELDLKSLYRAWRRQAPQAVDTGVALPLPGTASLAPEPVTDEALMAAAHSDDLALAHQVVRDLAPNTEALARALVPAVARDAGARPRHNPMRVLAMAAGFMAFALVGTLALRGKPQPAPVAPVVQQAPPVDPGRILDGSFEASEAIANLDLSTGNTVFRADFDG